MAAERVSISSNSTEGKVPFLIDVASGTASGKSTVCKKIMPQLGQADMAQKERQVVCISRDSFYQVFTDNSHQLKEVEENYTPSNLEFEN